MQLSMYFPSLTYLVLFAFLHYLPNINFCPSQESELCLKRAMEVHIEMSKEDENADTTKIASFYSLEIAKVDRARRAYKEKERAMAQAMASRLFSSSASSPTRNNKNNNKTTTATTTVSSSSNGSSSSSKNDKAASKSTENGATATVGNTSAHVDSTSSSSITPSSFSPNTKVPSSSTTTTTKNRKNDGDNGVRDAGTVIKEDDEAVDDDEYEDIDDSNENDTIITAKVQAEPEVVEEVIDSVDNDSGTFLHQFVNSIYRLVSSSPTTDDSTDQSPLDVSPGSETNPNNEKYTNMWSTNSLVENQGKANNGHVYPMPFSFIRLQCCHTSFILCHISLL